MRLSFKINVLAAVGAVALTLIGCQQAPWKIADQSVGALARDVATHAEQNDTEYFTGLSPARERVPTLIEQVRRSGIATNYAAHLRVDTPSEATLIYGVMGDTTPGTSFAVRLSLVDGQPRVDQIIEYQKGEVGESLGSPAGSITPSQVTPSAIGATSVSVAIASGRLIAGSEQSAVIGYTNASNDATSVALPLDVVVRITDADNALVSKWESPAVRQRTRYAFLTPWETIYVTVRFKAPDSGDYILYGSANGVQGSAINLQTVGQ